MGVWKRRLGNATYIWSKSMGGLRGRTNVASWLVAGTLAYVLWVKPTYDLDRQRIQRYNSEASNPSNDQNLPTSDKPEQ